MGFDAVATARLLSQPGTRISYNFWGTPYVVSDGPRGALNIELDDLGQRVRNFYRAERGRAMDYILAEGLVGRVRDLYELSDREILRVGFITSFFFSVRRIAYFIYLIFDSIRGGYESYGLSYFYFIVWDPRPSYPIPRQLVLQDPFLSQAELPDELNEDNCVYGHRQINNIARDFLVHPQNLPQMRAFETRLKMRQCTTVGWDNVFSTRAGVQDLFNQYPDFDVNALDRTGHTMLYSAINRQNPNEELVTDLLARGVHYKRGQESISSEDLTQILTRFTNPKKVFLSLFKSDKYREASIDVLHKCTLFKKNESSQTTLGPKESIRPKQFLRARSILIDFQNECFEPLKEQLFQNCPQNLPRTIFGIVFSYFLPSLSRDEIADFQQKSVDYQTQLQNVPKIPVTTWQSGRWTFEIDENEYDAFAEIDEFDAVEDAHQERNETHESLGEVLKAALRAQSNR